MASTELDQLRAERDRLQARVAELERQLSRREAPVEPLSRDAQLQRLLEWMPVMLDAFDAEGNIVMWNRECERVTGYSAEEIVGNPNAMAMLYPDAEYLERMMDEWRSRGDDYYNWEWTLTCKDGSQRTIAWSNISRRCPIPGWATWGIGVDVTERNAAMQRERALRQELEERVTSRTLELQQSNQRLREQLHECEQMEAKVRASEEQCYKIIDAAPVPMVITDTDRSEILYANRRALDRYGPVDIVGRSPIDFFYNQDEFYQLGERLRREGKVYDHELQVRRADGSVGWVVVSLQPITYEGRDSVLSAYWDITKIKQAEAAMRQEEKLLRRALELSEREHQLAAYDIHDGIVQYLTTTGWLLETFQSSLPEEYRNNKMLVEAIRLVQRSIEESRQLINGLRPPVLEDLGLIGAIRNLVEEIEASGQVRVQFRYRGQFEPLNPTVGITVFRIVQEALNNVCKHSQSARARVELEQQQGTLRIVAQDWGIGFDQDSVKERAFGLRGMRERSKLLGGSFRLRSKPGEGTRIVIELPLSSDTLSSDDSWTD